MIKRPNLWGLSSFVGGLAILVTVLAQVAQAHEIRPSIADVLVSTDTVDIELTLTLESIIAGIDLAELEDTNASPLSGQYDTLRGLAPMQLQAAFAAAWNDIAKGFILQAGDRAVALEHSDTNVPEIGDVAVPRQSIISLHADLPDDASDVVFGWISEYGALVVRQVVANGDGYAAYLIGGELSAPMPRGHSIQQPWISSFLDYIKIGYEHIVPKGLDHILFVLGLFFFSLKLRPLLTQITAFTLAHTVSLALATLGWITIPTSIVEPLIAASIVYVAIENLMVRNLHVWRTAVVFGFGLLHGLGFAAVLGDIGLDAARFSAGLIGFNVGVELGQLTVIAIAFLALGYWFGGKPWYHRVIAGPASIGIAIMGAYWFFERVLL